MRAPDVKEQAKADYLKGMKYKDLAEKYGVTLNTIKSWKQRYSWDRKSVHTKDKKGAHKRGAPKGSKNALGNNGGAPAKNKNAETHGFFTKFLPEDTLEIMQQIETRSPIDMLWDQIMIQYTAIIRSQKIMYVNNQEDLTKVLKREKRSDGDTSSSWEEEYELQFAWDKQANFLNAQSRAMKTLESMIKQYDELLNKNWDIATEEQKARIAVLKARAHIDEDGSTEDDGFIDALMGKVDDVWQEE